MGTARETFVATRERLRALVGGGPPHVGDVWAESAAYLGALLTAYQQVRLAEVDWSKSEYLDQLAAILGYRGTAATAASLPIHAVPAKPRSVDAPIVRVTREGQTFEGSLEALQPHRLVLEPGEADWPGSGLLLEAGSSRVVAEQLVVVPGESGPSVARVLRADPVILEGVKLIRVTLSSPPPSPRPGATLLAPSLSAKPSPFPRKDPGIGGTTDPFTTDGTLIEIALDSVYPQVRNGAMVVAELVPRGRGEPVFAARIVLTAGTEPVVMTPRGTELPATMLTLSGAIASFPLLRRGGLDDLVVHFNMVPVGVIARAPKTHVEPADFAGGATLRAKGRHRGLSTQRKFFLAGSDDRSILCEGRVRADETGAVEVRVDAPTDFPPLKNPVQVLLGVSELTQGKTVEREVLGDGTGAPRQAFALKRSPLTYLPSRDDASLLVPELDVWVNGIRWDRVDSFFHAGPEDPVYTVRRDAEGRSEIRFGDGERGRVVPSGVGNVVARYRYGAGAGCDGHARSGAAGARGPGHPARPRPGRCLWRLGRPRVRAVARARTAVCAVARTGALAPRHRSHGHPRGGGAGERAVGVARRQSRRSRHRHLRPGAVVRGDSHTRGAKDGGCAPDGRPSRPSTRGPGRDFATHEPRCRGGGPP